MHSNNETGVIQPLTELAAIAHASGALFHTDAVQAAGKLPLDLSPTGELKDVDLLSISGHKMYAPQGTGVLFVRRSVRLAPLFHGGSHERQRRAGTENVAGIVALGKAAELANTWLTAESTTDPGAPSFASFAKGGVSGESPTALSSDGPPANPIALAALRDRLEQTLLANPRVRSQRSQTPPASATPPASTSTTSKPKPSSSPSTSKASQSAEAAPASPEPPNPHTSSPPWASHQPAPEPPSASPSPASPPSPRSTPP